MTSKKTGDFPKITILYNEIRHENGMGKDTLATEEGGEEDAQLVADALSSVGHHTGIFELTEKSINELNSLKEHLIFNLADGIGSLDKTESEVPKILDGLGLSYTGAAAAAMILTTNKALTKIVFQQNNLPTAPFSVFSIAPEKLPNHLKFPLITKPVNEDCSLGISSKSVANNLVELKDNIEKILAEYKEPVLVEEYIDGREINATVIGNGDNARVLPLSEIVFGDSYAKDNKPKIVDFEAKWIENSSSYKDTAGVCPAILPEKVKVLLEDLALGAYKLTGARDYARVDFRLDKNLHPFILEVNVNPDLSPGMGASRSAKTSGLEYGEFMSTIAKIAAARYV